jgi:hypothetical protein
MLKPVLTLAAAGAVTIVLWKLLAAVLLPVVGALLGFVMLLVKVAFVAGLVWLALWLFRNNKKKEEGGEASA